MHNKQFTLFGWALLAFYAVATVILAFARGPLLANALLATVVPFAFFLVHGSCSYRPKDLLVFVAITLVVSNVLENLSILTGFPFGHYYYSDLLGPKLFLVPVTIGFAYLAMGYLSWTLARVILGAKSSQLPGLLVIAVPLLASFIMVSWDLVMDPLASTINQSWVWLDGGSYFGVPFSNYLGWFLTVFVFFQLFALYLTGRRKAEIGLESPSSTYWLQAVLFYGVFAASPFLNLVTQDVSGTVTDAANMVWRVQDIYTVCGLAAIFTMGVYATLSLLRLASKRSA